MAAFEPGSPLRRYQAGEHEAVWAEMMALGAKVREAPYFDDAWAVARETMRRARHNVELIIRRLDQIGYQFWDGMKPDSLSQSPSTLFEAQLKRSLEQIPEALRQKFEDAHRRSRRSMEDANRLMKGDFSVVPQAFRHLLEPAANKLNRLLEEKAERRDEQLRKKSAITDHLKDGDVFSPPTEESVAWIRELEEKGMVLPLSLRAWAEEVGGINLAGVHPRLCFWEDENFPGVYADPLMVTLDHFDFLIEGWLEEQEAGGDADTEEVVLGWDAKAKARLAVEDELLDYGYTIDLPNAAADAALDGEPHNTTFVNYLRIAFRWGGFPGWEKQEKRPEAELKFLTEGLLPI